MTSCFAWLALLVFAVLAMVSIIRWFEQITEAVDLGLWDKTLLLLVVPPAVWMFPSRTTAGRPTMVPRHQPVRGFGAGPTMPGDAPKSAVAPGAGTPPPPPQKKRSQVDPEMIAKLKQKMKEQGMLGDDEGE